MPESAVAVQFDHPPRHTIWSPGTSLVDPTVRLGFGLAGDESVIDNDCETLICVMIVWPRLLDTVLGLSLSDKRDQLVSRPLHC